MPTSDTELRSIYVEIDYIIYCYNIRDIFITLIPTDTTASLSTSDNYRGTSLFNSICKLCDYIIM